MSVQVICCPGARNGQVMGFAEMADGLGWSIAPPVGGLLYAAGACYPPSL